MGYTNFELKPQGGGGEYLPIPKICFSSCFEFMYSYVSTARLIKVFYVHL